MPVSIEEKSQFHAWPFIFQAGFRLFFSLAACQAIIILIIFVVILSGAWSPPLALDPVAWHAHEMLYGFVGAAIGGFLLTAVPNWTGRAPPAAPLIALMGGAWLLGRFVMGLGAALPVWLLILADLAYPLLMVAWTALAIFRSGNHRNLVVIVILVLFCLGMAFTVASDSETGWLIGIFAVVLLLSLIGGRVVPAFTGNWLRGLGETATPRPFGWPDRIAILSTLIAFALVLLPVPPVWSGWTLLLAGLLQAFRWSGWRFQKTAAEPIVWVMHVGYAWIPVGLILLGLAQLDGAVPWNAGIHALTAGAFGTMILAIMSRASLGHSGRPLKATRLTVLAYYAIGLGALGRVVSAWFPPLLHPAATVWAAAFVLFLVDFLPLLAHRPVKRL